MNKVVESMTGQFRRLSAYLLALPLILIGYDAFAASDINDIADNAQASVEQLPGLVSALSYALGLLLGVMGVLKLKEHVENPTQTPLRVGFVRLLAGGALMALPIVYEAALNTIGNDVMDVDSFSLVNSVGSLFGVASGIPIIGTLVNDFNFILGNIINSISNTPGVVSAVGYLLGLIIGVQGILKAKDHVENPDQTALKESVVRLLTAGALFALPTIYNSMFQTIGGGGSNVATVLGGLFGGANLVESGYSDSDCLTGLGSGIATILGALGAIIPGFTPPASTDGVGSLMCNFIGHASALPAFLTAVGYLIGLILGLWGILKLRDHVLNPTQTALWEGVSRLLAGGAFFSLPILIEVGRNTLVGGGVGGLTSFLGLANSVTGYNSTGCTGTGSLDNMLVCFMGDITGPLHIVTNFFAYVAGIIFIMIGISRLIKSAQDGARGPGGIGTVMTFVAGGALISYNEIVRAFSTSLVGPGATKTFAKIAYAKGAMTTAEAEAAHSTISAVLQFVIIVGLISFVRGIFIVRNVAEGNQQASIMAGVTHLIGGALAVNLGPLLNAVQTTLGLTGFGITFG